MFRLIRATHRWLALTLGALLLVIVVSGVALLYKPELTRLAHPSLYQESAGPPVGFQAARDAAVRAYPELAVSGVQAIDGRYEVYGEPQATVVVDAATGRVNGATDPQRGIFGFLDNLHECALACEGYTGHVAALDEPAVGGLFGQAITWGALLLGSLGLVLGFLVIGGLVLWWPGIRSMARGFRIRRRTTAYKLNYDLHKVVGIVALPFLAVWALTGTGFEFPFVERAWYAALPGSSVQEPASFESTPIEGRWVSMTQAVALAGAAVPAGRVAAVYLPDPADPASVWAVWISGPNDPYAHGVPGNIEARVDRYGGQVSLGYGAPGSAATAAESLWEHWNYPLHAGTPVNGWWRSLWLVLGLTPVLLAVTGTSTWWMRRRRTRRRTRAVST